MLLLLLTAVTVSVLECYRCTPAGRLMSIPSPHARSSTPVFSPPLPLMRSCFTRGPTLRTCLEPTAQVLLVNRALHLGLAAVSFTSVDRVSGCWDNGPVESNEDIARVKGALSAVVHRALGKVLTSSVQNASVLRPAHSPPPLLCHTSPCPMSLSSNPRPSSLLGLFSPIPTPPSLHPFTTPPIPTPTPTPTPPVLCHAEYTLC